MSSPTKNKCSVCGKTWVEHDGMTMTCSKLERARRTLKVIYTWARVHSGAGLVPDDVMKACERALKESE